MPSRTRREPAPVAHLGADPGEVVAREHPSGEREDHRLLDVDVLSVERFQRLEKPVQLRRLIDRERAVAKPRGQEAVDSGVHRIGTIVLGVQTVERGERIGAPRRSGPHSGKQRFLFIRRVPGRGLCEIRLRLTDGLGMLRVERLSPPLARHAEQNAKERFDAAVAVREQPERFVKAVIGSASEYVQRCAHAEYYRLMAPDDSEHAPAPLTPPLKRHAALQPLSREHMNGLIQARNLQRAAELDRPHRVAAVAAFVHAWRSEIREHFDDEERLLLPLVGAAALRGRLLDEHGTLRRLAERCVLDPEAAASNADLLREIGLRLHDHIRWEEREFFEIVQRDHPEALAALEFEAGNIEQKRPGARARHRLFGEDNSGGLQKGAS